MDTLPYMIEYRCAQALAREAGKRMIRERDQGFDISYKGTNDLVTNVDRSIENYLRQALHALFPTDRILGEEFGQDQGDGTSTSRNWMIDPIDGTTNFSKGIPVYCVSIGLQVDSKSVLGVIYDPTRDELFSGLQDHGALLNGQKITVTESTELKRAVLASGFPPIKEGTTFDDIVKRLGMLIKASRGIRRLGSAALDLAYVAAGRLDGFWEYNLHEWDTAAGYLIAQEAGALVSDDGGEEYLTSKSSIVAANPSLQPQILALLQRAQGTP